MTFPTSWTVAHHVAVIVAEDELGNNSVIFDAPVPRAVIGIAPVTVEELGAYTSRSITDVDLYVPADFTCDLQDRITLPNGDDYEVIGMSDFNFGWHQWQPGSVVKLKRVTG